MWLYKNEKKLKNEKIFSNKKLDTVISLEKSYLTGPINNVMFVTYMCHGSKIVLRRVFFLKF